MAGAKTLLIESAGCLGGAASMRGVNTYCGMYTFQNPPQQVVYGVIRQVVEGLREDNAITGPHRFRGVFLTFEPETNKRVLDEVCLRAGVQLHLHCRVIGAERKRDRITSLTVESAGRLCKVSAASFVDATGDATLAHLAQSATRYGNAGQVNLGSLSTRFSGIPAEVRITADQIAAAVARLRKKGIGPFAKERSVICRLPKSHDLVIYVVSHDYDPREPASITQAEIAGRRQARAYLQAIQTIAGCEGAYLVSTGPEFGTRESRHLNCDYQLTWQDITNRRKFDDCIALGAWGAEWHDRESLLSDMDTLPDKGYFQIPLGCLRSLDTRNLLAAGRTVDGDQKAGAAIRVLATAAATGQAAGVAASQIAATGKISVAAVQEELFRQGQTATPEQLR